MSWGGYRVPHKYPRVLGNIASSHAGSFGRGAPIPVMRWSDTPVRGWEVLPTHHFKRLNQFPDISLLLRIRFSISIWRFHQSWAQGPRRSMFGFPLLGSTPQRGHDVVHCRSIARILLPTKRRHFPQFLGVSSGHGEDWCLGPHTFKYTVGCHVIVVPIKWYSVRQNLTLLQLSGRICVERCSLRRWSSPSNTCPPSS